MINRDIGRIIESKLFKGKALVITGARQVGKTTLVKHIASKSKYDSLYLNCDEPDIQAMLERPSSTQLKKIFGTNKLVIIDEAQRIKDIGLTSKIIVDEIPDVQLILTGSSAFDIGNVVNESLTGRKFEFSLYPLSFNELAEYSSLIEEKRTVGHRLLYGAYPDIVNHPGEEQDRLLMLTSSYLFKDIFSIGYIKKPYILDKLVKALALQVGSEVSLNELSNLLGVDKNTISNYIDLLEKTFVIFSLNSMSSNQRNELKKSRKIYFWDNGIRNAVIKNFNNIELRTDLGAIWENYIISERIKQIHNLGKWPNFYFWRTYQKQEVDLIEEWGGKHRAIEIKWKDKGKRKEISKFRQTYPDSDFIYINNENFTDFLLEDFEK